MAASTETTTSTANRSEQALQRSSADFELTDTRTNITEREDVPPDGGYGWVCTTCVFLINAHTWGVNSAWGIFLAHYLSTDTYPGASQLEYALIGGLSISQALLAAPLVVYCNARFGSRSCLLLGAALVSASMLASSFNTHVWHFFLSFGCCFGWGMSFIYIPATTILPQWFLRKRSLAAGIAASGAGFGGLAYNLGTGAAIEALGVPWTYRLLALCTFVVNLGSAVLLRDRQSKSVRPSLRAVNVREFGHVSVALIVLWGIFTELGYVTLLYTLPSYARSIGLSAQQGSIVGAVLNLGLAFGRPVVGFLSDKYGRIDVATVMTMLCGIYCLAIWVPAKTYAVLLVFALFSGTVTGTFWGCVVPVTAEVVGLQRLQSAFAMICLPLVVPTTFAEPIALRLAATTGGYLSSQVFVGCMFLGGAMSTWALRSWKICDIEKDVRRDEQRDYVAEDWQEPVAGAKQIWLTPRRLFMNKRV